MKIIWRNDIIAIEKEGIKMQEIIHEILNQNIDRIILSNPKKKTQELIKVIVRSVLIQGKLHYQFEKYTQKQVFHENHNLSNTTSLLLSLMQEAFKQCDAFCESMNYSVKISKKEKVFVSRKQVQQTKTIKPNEHNRNKNYLIPDGIFIEPLYDLGIFSKEGKVINSMYDKYKQINRFIEMVDDCITPEMKHLNIIDFGCGKSYLTFILYYYLSEVKKISVHMVGLDLKESVIKNCNEIANKYGYQNLKFEVGDINGYKCEKDVDMVISLHACDTATDYALYNAIMWNAKMIFSVPCCQHELNAQIKSDNSIYTKYGLLKERMASILTDEIRANLLESESYKVQVLEFIDLAHSPKNILLRCVKSNKISAIKKQNALKEVENIMETFHVNPTLYQLLKKPS